MLVLKGGWELRGKEREPAEQCLHFGCTLEPPEENFHKSSESWGQDSGSVTSEALLGDPSVHTARVETFVVERDG